MRQVLLPYLAYYLFSLRPEPVVTKALTVLIATAGGVQDWPETL